MLQDLLCEGHCNVGPEVHDGGHGERGAADAHGEDLRDHQPRNRAKAYLVAAHVDHERHDRDQGPSLRQAHLVSVAVGDARAWCLALPEEEGCANERQGHDHHADAHEEQQAPAVLVHAPDGEERGEELHQAHAHRGQRRAGAEACVLEDVRCEVEDGRLPRDLLEEDEAAANHQGPGVAEGVCDLGHPLADAARDGGLHGLQLQLHLLRGLRVPEEAQGLGRLDHRRLVRAQQAAPPHRPQHQEAR
mmetsp:Transcript_101187/g.294650  ORF Transcript_101187/g.294650 Transcript_101187/m.294650 type:complete len:247 (+) Transcript_101187:274-1014(+)